MIICGYFAYILPVGIIGFILLFANSEKNICVEMKAPFLLDNNFEPTSNLTQMFEDRRHGSNRTRLTI